MEEYKINTELNGIEIYFQQKPGAKTIDQLKAEGWRWHNSKRCWYNRRNDTTLSFARRICGESESGELTQILTDLKCIRLKDRLKNFLAEAAFVWSCVFYYREGPGVPVGMKLFTRENQDYR